MTALDEALELRRRGRFPIPVNGKVPLVGKGYQNLRPDEEMIRREFGKHPNANIALLLEPSGLISVGPDNPASVDWVAQKGVPPTTVRIGKNPAYLYLRPEGCPITTRKYKANGIEVDIKASGICVVYGRHPETGQAVYLDGGDPAPAPAWAVNMLKERTQPRPPALPPQPVSLEDSELIEKALTADDGGKFARLWAGNTRDYDGDDSSADLALCNKLAFWTGRDADRMNHLFRQSGLYRDKWERMDYRQATIAKAIEACTEVYTPSKPPSRNGKQAVAKADTAAPTATTLTALTYPLTEAGDAELFAHLHGANVRYDHARGRYLLWSEHWWTEEADGELTRLALETTRTRRKLAGELEDPDASKRAFAWALGGEAKHRIAHTLDLAGSMAPIADSGRGWDADPWLLAVTNGIVDLRTGTIRPGLGAERIALHLDIAFDPGAQCPRWIAFLDEVFRDPELIDFIWRAGGYSLTGDISEQCLFVCYGTGSNGKSVFLTTLRRILGAFAWDAPFTTFELNARPAIPNDLAALAGKRLVTSSEANEHTRLNEARIKALTGGDPVTARFLHGEFFTFHPAAKFWLSVNHKPRVADDSHGFWRRVRLIPFTQRFEGSAVDPRLDAKLALEAPGILVWAVRGCLEWQRRGLKPPAAIQTATEQYRSESDPLGQFLTEACVIGPGYTVKGADLYKAYLGWAEAEGIRDRERLSHVAFGQRMGERFQKDKGRAGATYSGIGLALGDGKV